MSSVSTITLRELAYNQIPSQGVLINGDYYSEGELNVLVNDILAILYTNSPYDRSRFYRFAQSCGKFDVCPRCILRLYGVSEPKYLCLPPYILGIVLDNVVQRIPEFDISSITFPYFGLMASRVDLVDVPLDGSAYQDHHIGMSCDSFEDGVVRNPTKRRAPLLHVHEPLLTERIHSLADRVCSACSGILQEHSLINPLAPSEVEGSNSVANHHLGQNQSQYMTACEVASQQLQRDIALLGEVSARFSRGQSSIGDSSLFPHYSPSVEVRSTLLSRNERLLRSLPLHRPSTCWTRRLALQLCRSSYDLREGVSLNISVGNDFLNNEKVTMDMILKDISVNNEVPININKYVELRDAVKMIAVDTLERILIRSDDSILDRFSPRNNEDNLRKVGISSPPSKNEKSDMIVSEYRRPVGLTAMQAERVLRDLYASLPEEDEEESEVDTSTSPEYRFMRKRKTPALMRLRSHIGSLEDARQVVAQVSQAISSDFTRKVSGKLSIPNSSNILIPMFTKELVSNAATSKLFSVAQMSWDTQAGRRTAAQELAMKEIYAAQNTTILAGANFGALFVAPAEQDPAVDYRQFWSALEPLGQYSPALLGDAVASAIAESNQLDKLNISRFIVNSERNESFNAGLIQTDSSSAPVINIEVSDKGENVEKYDNNLENVKSQRLHVWYGSSLNLRIIFDKLPSSLVLTASSPSSTVSNPTESIANDESIAENPLDTMFKSLSLSDRNKMRLQSDVASLANAPIKIIGQDSPSIPTTPMVVEKGFNCLTTSLYRTSFFMGGKYMKHARGLSQTPWYVDGDRKGQEGVNESDSNVSFASEKLQTSVEELVARPIAAVLTCCAPSLASGLLNASSDSNSSEEISRFCENAALQAFSSNILSPKSRAVPSGPLTTPAGSAIAFLHHNSSNTTGLKNQIGIYNESVSLSENQRPVLQEHAPMPRFTFHASGREDVDVRMLGEGRPFIVEIQDPKMSFIPLEFFLNLHNAINSKSSGLLISSPVYPVSRAEFAALQDGADKKKKQYSALVWTSKHVTEEDLKEAIDRGIRDIKVNQRTPIRVMHRRSLMNRVKTIHEAKSFWLSPNFFVLNLITSAGAYVKEFCHGDLGRTLPNVGTILSDYFEKKLESKKDEDSMSSSEIVQNIDIGSKRHAESSLDGRKKRPILPPVSSDILLLDVTDLLLGNDLEGDDDDEEDDD